MPPARHARGQGGIFARVKNGDLLRLVADIERQRGPGSVALTKVKAHSDAAEAAAGAVSATDRAGNGKADRVAKAAADMQELPGTLALTALHGRHQVLVGIVRDFQQLMLAIMKRRTCQEDRRTVRSLGPRARLRLVRAGEPAFASFEAAARPAARPRGSLFVYDQARWSTQERLEQYVRNLRLVPATADTAVSWLELWAHFELKEKWPLAASCSPAERGRSERLARKETMMDLLGKLKWHVKRVAKAIWLEPEPLLTPVAKPRARLHCLGFHTVLACPSLLPWWPEDEVTAVTGRLLQLRGHCPASHLQDLRAGTLALQPQASLSRERLLGLSGRPNCRGPALPHCRFSCSAHSGVALSCASRASPSLCRGAGLRRIAAAVRKTCGSGGPGALLATRL